MNANVLRVVSVCVLMAASAASYAQSGQAASDQAGMNMAASAMPATGKATKADRALGRAVRRALARAQGFDVSGVFVRARSGAVTLSGTVRTGDQIRQAEDIARSVQGVTSVSNKLSLFHGGNG